MVTTGRRKRMTVVVSSSIKNVWEWLWRRIRFTRRHDNRNKKEDCTPGEIRMLDMNMYEQYCEDTESDNAYSLYSAKIRVENIFWANILLYHTLLTKRNYVVFCDRRKKNGFLLAVRNSRTVISTLNTHNR